jgi:hypothetical protein
MIFPTKSAKWCYQPLASPRYRGNSEAVPILACILVKSGRQMVDPHGRDIAHAIELQELSVHLDVDVTITGFETAEIDLLIRDLDGDSPDEADEVPEIDRSAPAVSRPGEPQVWL